MAGGFMLNGRERGGGGLPKPHSQQRGLDNGGLVPSAVIYG